MALEEFVRDKMVHTTHQWIAYKSMVNLPKPWKNLFLAHVEKLLEGSRAPDKKFHDFRNHVFHPPSWGGSPNAAQEWFNKFVTALKNKNWEEAVYNAGVLSHYIADPLHPFHTGQTEEEAKYHKLLEFGTARSLKKYDGIQVSKVDFSDLKTLVANNGKYAHQFYFDAIELYDMDRVKKMKWELGITEELHEILKEMLARAVSSIVAVWTNAISEASVKPPTVKLSLKALVLKIKMPMIFVQKWLIARYVKNTSKKILKEIKKKGIPYDSLPPDDRLQIDVFVQMDKEGKLDMTSALESYEKRRKKKVRKVKHLGLVKKKPLYTAQEPKEETKESSAEKDRVVKPKPTKKHEERKESKKESKDEKRKTTRKKKVWQLSPDDPIEEAPEVGKRTAEKLKKAGIYYVKDLLKADYSQIEKAGVRIKEADFNRWKAETKLMLEIPGLHVKDAFFLYGCGIKTRDELRKISKEELKKRLSEFMKESRAKSFARWVGAPTDDDIDEWLALAKE